MGPKRVYKHREFLKSLVKTSPQKRNRIIKGATAEQLKSIQEAILNVANNNIPISPCLFKKLKPYKQVIKKIAYSKPSCVTTRKLLCQRGGFIGALIPTVLSFLASHFLK